MFTDDRFHLIECTELNMYHRKAENILNSVPCCFFWSSILEVEITELRGEKIVNSIFKFMSEDHIYERHVHKPNLNSSWNTLDFIFSQWEHWILSYFCTWRASCPSQSIPRGASKYRAFRHVWECLPNQFPNEQIPEMSSVTFFYSDFLKWATNL